VKKPPPNFVLSEHRIARIKEHGGYGDRLQVSTLKPGDLWYKGKNRDHWVDEFCPDYKVRPGLLHVPADLLYWAAERLPHPKILIEPNVVGVHSADNKHWGHERWRTLVSRFEPNTFVQCVPDRHIYEDQLPIHKIPGVDVVETPSFAHAAAVLQVSLGYVGPEGGLSHAAGALRKPAVVIFGAFNRPSNFGYKWHYNLAAKDDRALGVRKSNKYARAAMSQISVDCVKKYIREAFNP
jgi:ADP-heptose:LPS heptosyltransferase